MKPLRLVRYLAVAALFSAGPVIAQGNLGVAEYTTGGQLVYPDNLDEWIVMGASLGADYKEQAFDPASPGSLGMVQMEPTAYRYFLEHREYADGTMFLLSFFDARSQSDPQLQGFIQGDMRQQEIHVIDSSRFAEGRGFFVYRSRDLTSAVKMPDGSSCVQCHTAEGAYNGTFAQFYPTIRDLIVK